MRWVEMCARGNMRGTYERSKSQKFKSSMFMYKKLKIKTEKNCLNLGIKILKILKVLHNQK